jgi:GNAT superfamily N-acetyltransferase
VWTKRLDEPDVGTSAIVAEQNGFVWGSRTRSGTTTPRWGALLENLHVVDAWKGRGIGTQLMATTAQVLHEEAAAGGLYLWVLEQNTAAQAFCESRGGICMDRGFAPPPGGEAGRLAGTPRRLRYVWRDPWELVLWLKP